MGKYIIKSMGNIDWMAVAPLLIFFSLFISVTIVWYRKSQKEVGKMADLPLNDETVAAHSFAIEN